MLTLKLKFVSFLWKVNTISFLFPTKISSVWSCCAQIALFYLSFTKLSNNSNKLFFKEGKTKGLFANKKSVKTFYIFAWLHLKIFFTILLYSFLVFSLYDIHISVSRLKTPLSFSFLKSQIWRKCITFSDIKRITKDNNLTWSVLT